MLNRARMLATATLLILGASPAWACPLCRSETGRRVREGLFDAQFGTNLLVTLLPFPVFLAVIALIHFGPPWAKGHSRRPTSPDAGDMPQSQPPTTEDDPWTTG